MKLKDTCEYKNCKGKATTIARGGGRGSRGIGKFCDFHADQVAKEGKPEYSVACPNCGCRFGVN